MLFADTKKFQLSVLIGDQIYKADEPNTMAGPGAYSPSSAGKFAELGRRSPSASRRSQMSPPSSPIALQRSDSGLLRGGVWVHQSRTLATETGPGSYSPTRTGRSASPRQRINQSPRWHSARAASVLHNGVVLLRGEVEEHRGQQSTVGPGAYADKLEVLDPIVWRSFNARCQSGNAPKTDSEPSSRALLRRARSFGGTAGEFSRGANERRNSGSITASPRSTRSIKGAHAESDQVLCRTHEYSVSDSDAQHNTDCQQPQLQPQVHHAQQQQRHAFIRTVSSTGTEVHAYAPPAAAVGASDLLYKRRREHEQAELAAVQSQQQQQQHRRARSVSPRHSSSRHSTGGAVNRKQWAQRHADTQQQQQQYQQEHQPCTCKHTQQSKSHSNSGNLDINVSGVKCQPPLATDAAAAVPLTHSQRVDQALKQLTGIDDHAAALMQRQIHQQQQQRSKADSIQSHSDAQLNSRAQTTIV